METNKNAFLVGMFVLVTTVVALGFTLWLTAAGRGETTPYRIYFSESVAGLSIGSVVRFNGVDVGEVKEMKVEESDAALVRVDVDVLKDAPVKRGTIARLTLQGLTGSVYIELEGGNPEEPKLLASAEHKIPEIKSGPSTVNTLMTLLPDILKKLDHTMGQIDKIFSDKNVKGINSVVKTVVKHYGSTEDEETK